MTEYVKDYLITALWSSVDENGNPLDDKYSPDNLSPCALLQADKDVTSFVEGIERTGDHDVSQLMHDFWLTRNGHGAGFWDGDYEKSLGEALTKLSESFGEVDLYVGDDGLLYFS